MLDWLAVSGQYPVALYVSFLSELVFLVAVLYKGRPTPITRVFLLILVSSTLVLLAQIAQLYVTSDVVFRFLAGFTSFNSDIIAVPLVLIFILYILHKRAWVMNPIFVAGLVVWVLFMTPLLLTTNLLFDLNKNNAELVNWMYQYKPGPWVGLIQANTLVLAVSVILVLIGYRTTKAYNQRRQLLYVALGFLSIVVAIAITKGRPHPFLAVPANLLFIYAILRYGFLATDKATIGAGVINIMQGAVIGFSPSGEIIFVNPHAKDLLGYEEKELTGKSVRELFPSEDQYTNFTYEVVKPVLDGKQVKNFEVGVLKKNQQPIYVSINASGEMDRSKTVPTGIMVLSDITALKNTQEDLVREKASVEKKVIERTKELHSEQAKLQASIEGLRVGFILIDADGTIAIQNQALQTIFDANNPLASLDALEELLDGFDLIETIKRVQTEQVAFEAKELSIGPKILHLFAAPVTTEDAGTTMSVGTVILLEDITEEKVLDRSKDEFFSIASHELRTPLTSIKGNASMIMQFYSDTLKDKQLKEMIDDIHSSSVRLIDIVNDFLDLSRLEQGKMAFHNEAFALDEIIESVMYEMKTVLQDKKLYLKFDKMTLGSLPKVWADKNRIKQVVYNMVGNATKFTEKGGITIAAEADKSNVKVLITDTGRGISPDEQRLLFRKFQQASSSLLTRDTTRGTGLGLYISRVMLEGMKGHMDLEYSELNKGSTFSFTIPIATPELMRAAAETPVVHIDAKSGLTLPGAAEPAGNQAVTKATPAKPKAKKEPIKHLLVIEDDPYVVRLYQRLFQFNKLSIDVATNGKDGLAKARTIKPRLILLDVMMPNMNGIEVLKELKKDETTKHIPVIMLSSLGEEAVIVSAKEAGAEDYIIKSDFTPEELLVKVQKYIG
jgi:PAS domain S-box-containing protein